MSTQEIEIYNRHTQQLVSSTLHKRLTPQQLVNAECDWQPVRSAAVQRLWASGVAAENIPQHWHWNWEKKAADLNLLAYRGIGIECERHMQGLMLLDSGLHSAQHPQEQGKPIVYIKYLETAPWNAKELEPNPRFSLIGTRLLEVAIRVSIEVDFKGRVGLHSLPQSEEFYRDKCSMHDLGLDAHVESLRYFEFDQFGAQAFLSGGQP